MNDPIQEITAGDGTTIPLYWYPATGTGTVLLLLPALGIQAKLYRRLAEQLCDRGHSVAVMEQRGHGNSALRPSYSCQFSLDDLLEFDIPAALDWLELQSPGCKIVLGGHSLGGHLSTIYAGRAPSRLAGVLHLACAFPHYLDYPGKERLLLRFLCTVMPLFKLAPGYYPGGLMGFGSRESIGMMMQWRQWCLSGSFDYDGHTNIAVAGAFTGSVLAIAFEQDNFATQAAIERALSPLSGANVSRVSLGAEEQGEYLGHVNWARSPEGTSACIAQWLAGLSTGSH
ncbi:alpha/beta fold hydrolase [Halioglobus maricola]|nr:alpha/beta fold hydrolase [Halioglobus maricola]